MGWLDKYQKGGIIPGEDKLISLPSDPSPIKDNNLKVAYANEKGLDNQQLSSFEAQDSSDESWRNNRDGYYSSYRQNWLSQPGNDKYSQTTPEYMSMIQNMKSSWFEKNQRPINDVVMDYRENGPKNPIRKIGDDISLKTGIVSDNENKKQAIPYKAQHGKKIAGEELKNILDKSTKKRYNESLPKLLDLSEGVPRSKKEVERIIEQEKANELSKIIDDRENARFAAAKNPLNGWDLENLSTFKNLTKENLSIVGKGLESQFRVSDAPNFFDDYLNPVNMIGGMASNLGQAPLEAEQSKSLMPYITSIGTPLAVGALGGLGAENTGQFVNNVINPLAGIKENIPTLPGLKNAKEFLNKPIIPKTKTVLPENLEFNVSKSSYAPNETFITLLDPKTKKAHAFINTAPSSQSKDWVYPSYISVEDKLQGHKVQDILYQKAIEDAQSKGYRGVRSGDHLISPEKTAKAHDRFLREPLKPNDYTINKGVPVTGLLRHSNPEVINDFFEYYKTIPKKQRTKVSVNELFTDFTNNVKNNPAEYALGAVSAPTLAGMADLMILPSVLDNYKSKILDFTEKRAEEKRKRELQDEAPSFQNGGWLEKYQNGGVIENGNFLKWYNENTLEGKRGVPYSDKLDYDYKSFYESGRDGNIIDHFPDTYKRPNHPTFSDESIYHNRKNRGGHWVGDKFVKSAPQEEYMNQKVSDRSFQNGGIIEDDRGQWAYPGEITKINSNDITMRGVNYPVLGISDEGDRKMMMPGQDYKFKGKSVTEYPMAQNGKTLNEKIVELQKNPLNKGDEMVKEDRVFLNNWLNSKRFKTKLKENLIEIDNNEADPRYKGIIDSMFNDVDEEVSAIKKKFLKKNKRCTCFW